MHRSSRAKPSDHARTIASPGSCLRDERQRRRSVGRRLPSLLRAGLNDGEGSRRDSGLINRQAVATSSAAERTQRGFELA